jgi:hypothetical protein
VNQFDEVVFTNPALPNAPASNVDADFGTGPRVCVPVHKSIKNGKESDWTNDR